jgi:hypothetical protein
VSGPWDSYRGKAPGLEVPAGTVASFDQLVAQLRGAHFALVVLPSDRTRMFNLTLATQVGVAALLDLPIVAVSTHGLPVPPGVARIAHTSVVVGDVNTPEGFAELDTKLSPIVEQLHRERP